MTLKFSPGNHQYRMDGKHVPSVTGLIKGGIPAPALMKWSARTVAEYVADNPSDIEQLRAPEPTFDDEPTLDGAE